MSSMIGQECPEFSLLNDKGETFESSSLNGTWRILFFYAKDGSPTCKRGCLNFKEQHDLFVSAGCTVVGISQDSVADHQRFKEELGGLPFDLLSDQEREVASQFGVPVYLGKFPAKSSFLVNPENKIHHVFDWLFRPRRHVAKILSELSSVTGDLQ